MRCRVIGEGEKGAANGRLGHLLPSSLRTLSRSIAVLSVQYPGRQDRRSGYKAVESYRHVPGPPLGCPVVALTGDDPQVTLDEAKA